MTRLRKMMLDELHRRNCAQSTVRTYITAVEDFARYFGKSPERLGPEHIRHYQVHLFRDRKLSAGTVEGCGAALRFLYVKTLRRPYLPDQIPFPKRARRLPSVLSQDEVALLIDCAKSKSIAALPFIKGALVSSGIAAANFPLCYKSRMRSILSCLLLHLFCGPKFILADVDPSQTTPIAPFRITDTLYYVGSEDLASYLVVTPKGNILLNANLASSPPQIRASVEKLGFHWSDTKILLNSQAHFDHVGGAAQVVRETHAKNMVMDGDVSVVETGARTDFLSPSPNILTYAPVHVDRVLHDGDTVTLGNVTLTAHKTAGHTRGCTTWTMRSHLPREQAGTMRNVVIVGGVTFWSEYHFVATPGHPVSYPNVAQDFQHTFSELRALPCDVFLGAHGEYFDMLAKLKRYPQAGPRIFIDPTGYKRFVADAQESFRKALSKQQAAAAH